VGAQRCRSGRDRPGASPGGRASIAGQTCSPPTTCFGGRSVRPALIKRPWRPNSCGHYGGSAAFRPIWQDLSTGPVSKRLSGPAGGARPNGVRKSCRRPERSREPSASAPHPGWPSIRPTTPLMARRTVALTPRAMVPSLPRRSPAQSDAPKLPGPGILLAKASSAQGDLLAGTSSEGSAFNDVVIQVGVAGCVLERGRSGMGNYHAKARLRTPSRKPIAAWLKTPPSGFSICVPTDPP